MAGELSRDFARTMSTVLKELQGMKEQLKTQDKTIAELKKKVDAADDKVIKQQGRKVRQASMDADNNELERLIPVANGALEEEMLRQQINYTPDLPEIQQVNNHLIENYRQSYVGKPQIQIEIKQTESNRRPTFADTNESRIREMKAIEEQGRQQLNKLIERRAQQSLMDENALGKLSSNWLTEFDR